MAEAVELVGLVIEAAPRAQGRLVAVAPLRLLIDVGQVEDAGLERSGREDELDQVVPSLADTSAAARVGISAWLMWSTVTFTPTSLPHDWAKGSNHLSWRGTKRLRWRILRSPDSFSLGLAGVALLGCDGLPHPVAVAAAAIARAAGSLVS